MTKCDFCPCSRYVFGKPRCFYLLHFMIHSQEYYCFNAIEKWKSIYGE